MLGAVLALVAAQPATAADYPTTVLRDHPLGYYRLNNPARTNIAYNLGTIGAAGNATNLNVHPVGGAIANSLNGAAYFNGSGARSIIPFNPALNPNASNSFTIEAWIQPSVEVTDGPGPSPLMNRYSYPTQPRQGWVYFQRSPETGWNFRMYSGDGSNVGVSLTGQSSQPNAGRAGTWNHLVTVWDGPNSTATMYVNGEQVAQGSGTYAANTDDHSAADAPNGAPGLSVGAYNNTQPGENPFHGAIDEVAFYTNRLSAAEALAHYQAGTNAFGNPDYAALVLAQKPAAYQRFGEPSPDADLAINFGSLGPAGDATNAFGVKHPAPGMTGVTSETATSYQAKNGGGGGVQTQLPWRAELNPEAASSFTVEAWFQPHEEVSDSPGPAPLMNRYSYPNQARQGWVYFQRSPETGWNFRMYSGDGSSAGVDITGQSPQFGAGTAGTWNHVVTVWDGLLSMATLYVNAELVAQGSATYAPNTDDHGADAPNGPAGLAIGSYNNTQPGENPFNGSVANYAFYASTLSPDQILNHYQTGTNSLRGTNYAAVVLADLPVEFLPLGEPAYRPAANLGTLGGNADGSVVFATDTGSGPQPPPFPGFEAGNLAVPLDGTNAYVTLNNPAGLNFAGPISLEAWIQPAATQGAAANIIAHGPTSPDNVGVGLQILDGSAYAVGSSSGPDLRGVTAPIPAGDLTGSAWVYLVGTYDGTRWTLYRNGTLLATADDQGPFPVSNANWSFGQNGDGKGGAFAGAVDELAIYNVALTAAQVRSHYAAATGSAPELSVDLDNGQVALTWAAGTLQQSATLGGTFTDVPGNPTSPYHPPGDAPTRFYGLRP